ncbi:MAG: class I tRNA ligase family protein [Candidatus Nealsonbacteria bacterium]
MKINFPKLEKKILKFWRDNEIFKKSIKKRSKASNFVFYEGPPTANGKPGIHHVLCRVFKDIICRYKTMQGFRVLRKGGWDTHGLPVELQIEKELGLKSKKDIEKYGISKFNKKCKDSVWRYKKDWEKLTERIGFWLDMDNPYIIYTSNYIESIWWILKEVYKKGLLYQDFKVVHYCPRCGTSLSTHEVAQGYKKIKEPSIFIKLRIKNLEFKGSYLLVWTTTPWTLPGNVAVAVNPNFTYAKVKIGNEYLILAKDRISTSGIEGEIVEEFKGKDLTDLRYEGLYPIDYESSKNAYRVILGDFVSLEEGTGLVHLAPAFGEEDMEVIRTQNKKHKTKNIPEIPILLTINEEGRFNLNVKKWAGMYFKDADPLIIKDLKKRNLLFKEELYEHDYPFCWRCKTPLLYYAKKSWFIKMKKVKQDLIKNNKKINWVPAYLKEGRFGEWLREVKDWALSRERYWGTPLPVWKCKTCLNSEVIGGKEDLLKQKFSTNKYLILRHGETIYVEGLKEIIYSKSDNSSLGLTKKGKKQMNTLAKKLRKSKIDLIFSSDYLRTRKTADIIAKELGLKVNFDRRLRDINLGIYKGKRKEELYKAFLNIKERFYKKPKNGEDWLSCRRRMISFIKEIDRKYQNQTILIISHGDPLWILEGTLRGLSQEEFVKQKIQKKTIKPGELRRIRFNLLPLNKKGEFDFHRPYIDEVKFSCQRCGGLMERVPELIDCWFDSGSMPFAQYHYPFENKKIIDQRKQFPADFISEGVDQTRGWFYTLLAISTLVGKGPSYKNVVSLGHILDEKGEKMSKSKGNVVNPWYIAEKYGVDAVRWYFYTINQPGDSKLFSEKDVGERLKKFIMNFWNCFSFFVTYTPVSYFSGFNKKRGAPKSKNILDKWIISELNKLILDTTKLLDKYDITAAARLLENFVVNNLSLWYIRRSRKRFQRPETKRELKEASKTLGFVLLTLTKLTAPFIPFLSEAIYQKVQDSRFKVQGFKSVHLEDWPKIEKKKINKKLNKKMEEVRKIVGLALAERVKAGLKVKQPLQELKIKNQDLRKEKELLELIKEEVNVKKITFGKTLKLDTKISPELKKEGILREVIRNLQQMRKEASCTPKDIILIQFKGEEKITRFLLKNREEIIRKTKAKDLIESKKGKFKMEKELDIEGEKLKLSIKKIRRAKV